MAEELLGIEEEVNSEIASAAEPFVDPRRQGKEYYQRRSTKEKRLETEEEAEAGLQSCQEGDLRRRRGRQEQAGGDFVDGGARGLFFASAGHW